MLSDNVTNGDVSEIRVALDLRFATGHYPGIGRYILELARALALLPSGPRLTFVHDSVSNPAANAVARLSEQAPDRIRLLEVPVRPRSLAEQWWFLGAGRRLTLDLWHAPYMVFPYALGAPVVVNLPDALVARQPRTVPSWPRRIGARAATALALRRADLIMTGTAAAARDLIATFGIQESTLRTVPLGVSQQFRPLAPPQQAATRARLGLTDRYALHVGTPRPHKNIDRLLEGFARYRCRHGDDLTLVLAGRAAPRSTLALRRHADRLGLSHRVRFWNDVPEADLADLYACAQLFVFPSLGEGFGLPVLEAMASGVPVAAAHDPALVEVAGEAAVHFVARDPDAIAGAIASGLRHRGVLRDRGLRRARRFPWRRTAELTAEVYAEAAGRR